MEPANGMLYRLPAQGLLSFELLSSPATADMWHMY
jgi:hypothetical protein